MADTGRKTRNAALIVFILYFVLIISPAGFADIIYFKNGETLECEIVKYTGEQVGVQAGNKFFYISAADIDKIEEKDYFQKDPEVDWLIVCVTAGLSVLMFSLAIWGREL